MSLSSPKDVPQSRYLHSRTHPVTNCVHDSLEQHFRCDPAPQQPHVHYLTIINCYLRTHSNQCICLAIKLFLQGNNYHLELFMCLFSNETWDLWKKPSISVSSGNLKQCCDYGMVREEVNCASCRIPSWSKIDKMRNKPVLKARYFAWF